LPQHNKINEASNKTREDDIKITGVNKYAEKSGRRNKITRREEERE